MDISLERIPQIIRKEEDAFWNKWQNKLLLSTEQVPRERRVQYHPGGNSGSLAAPLPGVSAIQLLLYSMMAHMQDSPFPMRVDQKDSAKAAVVLGNKNI